MALPLGRVGKIFRQTGPAPNARLLKKTLQRSQPDPHFQPLEQYVAFRTTLNVSERCRQNINAA